MMAKGVGGLMVVVSAALIGRYLAEPYRQRVRGLAEWTSFLERLKVEITFRQRPIAEAFEISATTPSLKNASRCLAEALTHGRSLAEASQAAVASDRRLGPEEQKILAELIPPLASAPAWWQGQALDYGAEEMSRILTGIRDEFGKKARMVETLSTLAGVTAVLILL